jgi:hypothetical protein
MQTRMRRVGLEETISALGFPLSIRRQIGESSAAAPFVRRRLQRLVRPARCGLAARIPPFDQSGDGRNQTIRYDHHGLASRPKGSFVFCDRLALSLALVMLDHSPDRGLIPARRKPVSFHRCFLLCLLTIRQKRLTAELAGGTNERTVRLRVPDVDHPEIATTRRLADGHPGAVSSGSVLSRIFQDLLHFFLADVVIPDVRLTGYRIQVEAKVHPHQYRRRPAPAQTRAIAPVGLTTRALRRGRFLAAACSALLGTLALTAGSAYRPH